jgi:hypothetical protein
MTQSITTPESPQTPLRSLSQVILSDQGINLWDALRQRKASTTSPSTLTDLYQPNPSAPILSTTSTKHPHQPLSQGDEGSVYIQLPQSPSPLSPLTDPNKPLIQTLDKQVEATEDLTKKLKQGNELWEKLLKQGIPFVGGDGAYGSGDGFGLDDIIGTDDTGGRGGRRAGLGRRISRSFSRNRGKIGMLLGAAALVGGGAYALSKYGSDDPAAIDQIDDQIPPDQETDTAIGQMRDGSLDHKNPENPEGDEVGFGAMDALGMGATALHLGGKSLAKKLPGVGLAVGAGLAVGRLQNGDILGAIGEFSSGLLSMIPGIGTMASVAIDASMALRDLTKETEKNTEAMEENTSGFLGLPTSAISDWDGSVVGQGAKPSAAASQSQGTDAQTAQTTTTSPAQSPATQGPVPQTQSQRVSREGIGIPQAIDTSRFGGEVGEQIVSTMSASLKASTQQAVDRHVKYNLGGKDINDPTGIDCSGWVAEMTQQMFGTVNKEMGKPIYTEEAMKVLQKGRAGGSEGLIKAFGEVAGEILTGDDVTADKIREGMMIGLDTGPTRFDQGREMGIDHIGMTYRDPETGDMMISESVSGKGVRAVPYREWEEKHQKRGAKFYAVDTTKAATREEGTEKGAETKDTPPPEPDMSFTEYLKTVEKKRLTREGDYGLGEEGLEEAKQRHQQYLEQQRQTRQDKTTAQGDIGGLPKEGMETTPPRPVTLSEPSPITDEGEVIGINDFTGEEIRRRRLPPSPPPTPGTLTEPPIDTGMEESLNLTRQQAMQSIPPQPLPPQPLPPAMDTGGGWGAPDIGPIPNGAYEKLTAYAYGDLA